MTDRWEGAQTEGAPPDLDERGQASRDRCTLADLRAGEVGVLDRLELESDQAQRLMEMGFIPGILVSPVNCAPGGDPRIYRVDGCEIALRHETAMHLVVDVCPPTTTMP